MSPNELIARSFVAGAMDLRRHEALLNRINVFPVIDADTGTNMCQTLRSTVDWVTSQSSPAFDAFAGQAARCVLRDARGNSGVIFGQFLAAFFSRFAKSRALNLDVFTDCVRDGKKAAYRSVKSPQEGTILSVISALLSALSNLHSHRDDETLTRSDHLILQQALADAVTATPSQLSVLKEAGVVDSGALGFYFFAAGFTLALPAANSHEMVSEIDGRTRGEASAPLRHIADTIRPAFLDSAPNPKEYRYCLNILVECDGEFRDDEMQIFDGLGGSVDVAMHEDLLKLHIHTNDKDAAKAAAGRIGRVVDVAFDDMSEGLVTAMVTRGDLGREKVSLRVVGDSSMSIGPEHKSSLGIYNLENYVSALGQMVTGNALDRDLLFARMREGHVFKTAMASRDDVTDFFGRMLAISEHVLFFAVGLAYSGTQELVRGVVADHPQKERITILDTLAASGQQGLACVATARGVDSESNVEALIQTARRQIDTCVEYLVIDDLKYLARSGRIGKVKAAFAGVLAIKPIVGHGKDGARTFAKVRSHDDALKYIVDQIRARAKEGRVLLLVEFTDNPKWAAHVAEELRKASGDTCEILTAPLSPTSAVHMGPGTWGVAVTQA